MNVMNSESNQGNIKLWGERVKSPNFWEDGILKENSEEKGSLPKPTQ